MKKSKRRRRFIDGKVQVALILQLVKHWFMFLFGAFVLLFLLQVLHNGPRAVRHRGTWKPSGASMVFLSSRFLDRSRIHQRRD